MPVCRAAVAREFAIFASRRVASDDTVCVANRSLRRRASLVFKFRAFAWRPSRRAGRRAEARTLASSAPARSQSTVGVARARLARRARNFGRSEIGSEMFRIHSLTKRFGRAPGVGRAPLCWARASLAYTTSRRRGVSNFRLARSGQRHNKPKPVRPLRFARRTDDGHICAPASGRLFGSATSSAS